LFRANAIGEDFLVQRFILKNRPRFVLRVARLAQKRKRRLGDINHVDSAMRLTKLVPVSRLVVGHFPIATINFVEDRSWQRIKALLEICLQAIVRLLILRSQTGLRVGRFSDLGTDSSDSFEQSNHHTNVRIWLHYWRHLVQRDGRLTAIDYLEVPDLDSSVPSFEAFAQGGYSVIEMEEPFALCLIFDRLLYFRVDLVLKWAPRIEFEQRVSMLSKRLDNLNPLDCGSHHAKTRNVGDVTIFG
jgi:hypothetical protein